MMSPTLPRVVLLDGGTDLGKELLGGKAWGIQRMRRLAIPVPPAFALPVTECERYHDNGRRLPDQTWEAVLEGLRALEDETGRRLGDPSAPLLLSVRSGAPVSMPGMMDTVLNVGMTDEVERGLSALFGDAEFARDTHCRFCEQFGQIVLGADVEAEHIRNVERLRAEIAADCGVEVPQEPLEQLREAICAVFDSWHSRRATVYRSHLGIGDEGGTAVTVQAMVFGNLGADSGTGVYFTRDPLSGEDKGYGEWLPGGQGDDVVSGTHQVQTLDDLKAQLPAVHAELLEAGRTLERVHGDIQDIEFTVERGRLFLLQTRSAKRSPAAAVRVAVDLADSGLIDRPTALRRVAPEQVVALLRPRLAEGADPADIVARGVAASPGVSTGIAVGDSETAVELAGVGGDVVLVRPTTSPEDIAGMIAARAVVTQLGGSTSHAAVVARALARPCVVGVGVGHEHLIGRELTVDGTSGCVYEGRLPLVKVRVEDDPALSRLLQWAQQVSPVNVIEVPTADAVDLDAVGIGLNADELPEESEVIAALQGAQRACGAILGTPRGADAAVAAGLSTIVITAEQHALVVLLHLLHAQARKEKREGVAA